MIRATTKRCPPGSTQLDGSSVTFVSDGAAAFAAAAAIPRFRRNQVGNFKKHEHGEQSEGDRPDHSILSISLRPIIDVAKMSTSPYIAETVPNLPTSPNAAPREPRESPPAWAPQTAATSVLPGE